MKCENIESIAIETKQCVVFIVALGMSLPTVWNATCIFL